MANVGQTPEGVRAARPSLPGTTDVRIQLDRLLNSHQFRSSKRCHSLLQHITECALAGDISGLKERTLGVEVFGRAPDYDSNQDPIVRATAAEIRKKLAQYYQSPEHAAELRIHLLPGSYVPEFHFAEPAVSAAAMPPRIRRTVLLGAVGVSGLCIILLAAIWGIPKWRPTALDQFWAPVLDARGDVLICIGQQAAYNPRSAQAQGKIQRHSGERAKTDETSSGMIPVRDLVILRDRYITLNDAISLVKVTSFLERHRKQFLVRGEASTSFTDLSERPAVLIGAFDNQWTLNQDSQMRFVFELDTVHDVGVVRDRQHPEQADWSVNGAWPYWDIPTDYAIVSRVFDVNTDRPVVVVAGITHFGTVAAGELLTDPQYFSELVPLLPGDWPKRNLQAVLRVPVVHGVPGHPHIVATHSW